VRITAIDHGRHRAVAAHRAAAAQYPDLHVEISSDYRLVDIAAERYDIGVRHGDQVEKDMIAVRLTADVPMAIVGAPAYFAWHSKPASLQELLKHNCINLRLPSSGGLYAWELRHEGRDLEAGCAARPCSPVPTPS
jgi:DNA-binding transcriptional LysR family regulator